MIAAKFNKHGMDLLHIQIKLISVLTTENRGKISRDD